MNDYKEKMANPVQGLTFHDQWNDKPIHKYRYAAPGTNSAIWVPHSVSKVVKQITPFELEQINKTKHIWEPRGNGIHQAMEDFSKGKPINMLDYAEWIEPAIKHPLFKSWELVAAEYSVIDIRYMIAGRFDGLFVNTNKESKFHGKLCLLDYKSQGRPEAKPYKSALVQCGAYANILDHCKKVCPEFVAVMWIRPGKTTVDLREAADPIADYLASRSLYFDTQPVF